MAPALYSGAERLPAHREYLFSGSQQRLALLSERGCVPPVPFGSSFILCIVLCVVSCACNISQHFSLAFIMASNGSGAMVPSRPTPRSASPSPRRSVRPRSDVDTLRSELAEAQQQLGVNNLEMGEIVQSGRTVFSGLQGLRTETQQAGTSLLEHSTELHTLQEHGRQLVGELRTHEENAAANVSSAAQQMDLEVKLLSARLKQLEATNHKLHDLESNSNFMMAQLASLADTVKAMQVDGTKLQQQLGHVAQTLQGLQQQGPQQPDPWAQAARARGAAQEQQPAQPHAPQPGNPPQPTQRLHSDRQTDYFKPWLEYKAVTQLKEFSGDRRLYKEWNSKLLNALSSTRRGTRELLRWVQTLREPGHAKLGYSNLGLALPYEDIAEDLWAVLSDRLCGDALDKLNSAPNGDGIEGLRIVHAWYTMMAGLGLTQMRQRLLHPPTPAKETDVAEALEAWDRLRLELKALEGADWVELPEKWEKAALERFLIGNLKDALDGELDNLSAAQLRKRILSWALRRKQEAVVSMDVEPQPLNSMAAPSKNACENTTQHSTPHDTEMTWSQGYMAAMSHLLPWGSEHLAAMGKGKAAMKGKGKNHSMSNGWQKGKGKGKGTCWTCGQQGHRSFECPETAGKGPVCWTCGQAGHRQSDCPSNSSKGLSKGAGKGIR